MATRAFIIVEIPNSMLNKEIRLSIDKLPNGLSNNSLPLDSRPFPPTIKLTNGYIQVYHHWDGYLEGLGEHLVKYYNDLDKALNLVSGGDMSTCMDGDNDNEVLYYYYYQEHETWKGTKPVQDNTIPSAKKSCIDYQYLFRNGKWYFRHWGDTRFKLVSLHLKRK